MYALGKVFEEGIIVGGIFLHQIVGFRIAIEKLLVRMEKTLFVEQILEIEIIETCWSLKVKGCQHIVISTFGALALP